MISTIDKAGRVVIPAPMRARAGLEPGTALEITADELGIHIVRKVSPPELVRVRGRLIARPTAPTAERPELDPAALVEEERDRWP